MVNCGTATTKHLTCVGIIVSRMLLIVSMVSCSEGVLPFSLLLGVGVRVLGRLGVRGCSDSLPKVLRAFSETSQTS